MYMRDDRKIELYTSIYFVLFEEKNTYRDFYKNPCKNRYSATLHKFMYAKSIFV